MIWLKNNWKWLLGVVGTLGLSLLFKKAKDSRDNENIENLNDKEKKVIAVHQICHELVKAERTYNVAKDFAINDIINKDDYIYRGGNDDVVRKAGCDMWKFETWLSKCPVTIYKREDCANGWIEMHFIIDDEREED